jgi:hypothetical protein
MRAAGAWPDPFTLRQGVLSKESVVSLVDAAVAHELHGKEHNPRLKEGSPSVATFVSESVMHMAQTIQVDCGILCAGGTTTASVNFDLVLVPTGAVPDITATTLKIENVGVTSETDSWLQTFDFFWNRVYLPLLDLLVSSRIAAQMEGRTGSDFGAPPPGQFFCFTNTTLTLCP